jgi:hypothetical protein
MKTQMVERQCDDRRQYDPDFAIMIDRRHGDERRRADTQLDLSDASLGISDSAWKMLFDIPKKYWRE